MVKEISEALPDEVTPVLDPHLTLIAMLDEEHHLTGQSIGKFIEAVGSFATSTVAFRIRPHDTVVHSPVKYCKEDTKETGKRKNARPPNEPPHPLTPTVSIGLQALALMFTALENAALYSLRSQIDGFLDLKESLEHTHHAPYEPHLSLVYWRGAEQQAHEKVGDSLFTDHRLH